MPDYTLHRTALLSALFLTKQGTVPFIIKLSHNQRLVPYYIDGTEKTMFYRMLSTVNFILIILADLKLLKNFDFHNFDWNNLGYRFPIALKMPLRYVWKRAWSGSLYPPRIHRSYPCDSHMSQPLPAWCLRIDSCLALAGSAYAPCKNSNDSNPAFKMCLTIFEISKNMRYSKKNDKTYGNEHGKGDSQSERSDKLGRLVHVESLDDSMVRFKSKAVLVSGGTLFGV